MKLRAGLNLGEKGGKGEEKDKDHYSKEPYRLKLQNIFDIFKLLGSQICPSPSYPSSSPKG